MDKPLETPVENLSCEIPIQAGAALTEKRVCELNDHDNFSDSISKRNRRYCECSAIYWIGKHIDSDYVGIEHYRRRFETTEEKLDEAMEACVDIITTKPMTLEENIQRDFIQNHYGGDWIMLMSLLEKYDSDNYEFYVKEADKKLLHYGNISIMRGDIFKEYCDWMFPILNEFYINTVEKYDAYNRRDVGFLAERLTHFFVMRKMRDGARVEEWNVKQYSRHAWSPKDECNLVEEESVYEACNRLYDTQQITKCCQVLGTALKNKECESQRLLQIEEVLWAGIRERMHGQITMYEYLPEDMKKDLNSLCTSYGQLKQIIGLYVKNPSEEMKTLYQSYIQTTGYSTFLVDYILDGMEV